MAFGLSGTSGVGAALRSWIGGLGERADRNELMAAETFFTGIILANAMLVGLTAVAVFSFLTRTIYQGILW